jgi:hypothetical protein
MRGGQADMGGIRIRALGNQSGLQNPPGELPRSGRDGKDFALTRGKPDGRLFFHGEKNQGRQMVKNSHLGYTSYGPPPCPLHSPSMPPRSGMAGCDENS